LKPPGVGDRTVAEGNGQAANGLHSRADAAAADVARREDQSLCTRRRFLGAAGAVVGLAACGPFVGQAGSQPTPTSPGYQLPTPAPAFAADKPDLAVYPIGSTTIFTDKRVGLMRDQDGFSAIRTECTYGRCTVRWYQSEQKWKCPCHGDEFDRHGVVQKGPTSRSLESVSVSLDADGSLRINPSSSVARDFRLRQ
jgi:Rieske Fe-S protein